MLRAAAEGHRVILVVATYGEEGEVPDGFLEEGELLEGEVPGLALQGVLTGGEGRHQAEGGEHPPPHLVVDRSVEAAHDLFDGSGLADA